MKRKEHRIKIFKRACKESGCFCYKGWMKNIIDFISYGEEIFFGSFAPKPPAKNEYKCQLLFLKISAENKILTKRGTLDSLIDTFRRYNYKALRIKGDAVYNNWVEVSNFSEKDNIKKEIIEYAKNNGQYEKYLEWKATDPFLNVARLQPE